MSGLMTLRGGLKFLGEGQFKAGAVTRGLEIMRFFSSVSASCLLGLRILGRFVRGLGGFSGKKTGVQPGLAATSAPLPMGGGRLKFLGEGRFAAGSAGRGPEIMRFFSTVSALFLSGPRILGRSVSGLGGFPGRTTDAQPGFGPSRALVPVPLTACAPARRMPCPAFAGEVRR
jgi:hypothetical protein